MSKCAEQAILVGDVLVKTQRVAVAGGLGGADLHQVVDRDSGGRVEGSWRVWQRKRTQDLRRSRVDLPGRNDIAPERRLRTRIVDQYLGVRRRRSGAISFRP